MNSLDIVRMGFKNLFRRKVRTFLTVLGVIIGTAAIVIMVSLGIGMNETFTQQIKQLGSLTVINVMPGAGGNAGGMQGQMGMNSGAGQLNDKTIASIEEIKGVQAATPLIEAYLRIVSGKYALDANVTGINPEKMKYFEYKIQEGRLLEKGDAFNLVFGGTSIQNFMNLKVSNSNNYMQQTQNQKPKVNVLRDKLIMTFDTTYGNKKSPFDTQTRPPKLYKIKGVGLMATGNQDSDWRVYMSLDILKKLVKDNNKQQASQSGGGMYKQGSSSGYTSALVKVDDMENVAQVQKKIKELGLEAYSLTDYLTQMQNTSKTIQMVLGGIGAVSLLIAALGITNTMIMSIYERTREIGVMKVIGAQLSDIKRMFLFESCMIGLVGGVLGLGISVLGSYILNTSGGSIAAALGGGMVSEGGPATKISVIPLWLMGFSLAFTTFVGLVSGYHPAKRAMKLSPIEAIKTE